MLRTGDKVIFENKTVTVLEDLGDKVVILHGDINNLNEQTISKLKLKI